MSARHEDGSARSQVKAMGRFFQRIAMIMLSIHVGVPVPDEQQAFLNVGVEKRAMVERGVLREEKKNRGSHSLRGCSCSQGWWAADGRLDAERKSTRGSDAARTDAGTNVGAKGKKLKRQKAKDLF